MRLTHVELFSNDVEMLSFNLNPNDVDPLSKYQVRSIFGLDADEIIRKFYAFGQNTQPRYYNVSLKAREIAIRLALNPNFRNTESYSDLRDRLYRTIAANRTGMVKLHFNSGATTVAQIEGSLAKFEVPYFSELSEIQITVKCDDPLFRAINPVNYEPESLSTTSPLTIADSISTSPHGFTMQMTFDNAAADLVISDAPSDFEWQFKVVPAGGFLVGDELHFSSEFSNKYLYIMRSSTKIDLIDKIYPTSVWPIIFPGSNVFYINDITDFDWDSLEYYAAYWGV